MIGGGGLGAEDREELDEPGHSLVSLDQLDEGLHGGDPGQRRAVGVDEALGVHLVAEVQRGGQQFFLVAEVVEQAGLGEFGTLGDPGKRGAAVAVLGELLHRDVQNPGAPGPADGVAAAPSGTGGCISALLAGGHGLTVGGQI